MLYHVGIAFAGIALLMGVWVLAQALKRRSDPRYGPGDDVLAGCDACTMGDVCDVAGHAGADGCARPATVPPAGRK